MKTVMMPEENQSFPHYCLHQISIQAHRDIQINSTYKVFKVSLLIYDVCQIQVHINYLMFFKPDAFKEVTSFTTICTCT